MLWAHDLLVLHPLSFLSRAPGSSPNEKALRSRGFRREVAREKAHGARHGNEYQVKIVHEDGAEEVSGWMNNEAQVAQVMAAVHRPQGNTYWLRERTVVCPNCLDREQRVMEYPLTDSPSLRCSPHDSRYLLAVGSRDRHGRIEVVIWNRHRVA